MNFWDTSALVAMILQEKPANTLEAILHQDRDLSLWWGTFVEFASVISRRERDGSLSAEQGAALSRRFNVVAGSGQEVPPVVKVRRLAERLVRVHPLKAADALQLAAALAIAKDDPSSIGFVCLDDRLNQAAAREGFRLLP